MEAAIETSAGRVARNFLALGTGEAVGRLIAFGATVYAARVLGPSDYGIIGVAAAVVLYLNRIVDAGFDLGLGVRELAADPEFARSAGPAVLGFRTLLAIVLAALAALAGQLFLPHPDADVLAIQGLTLLAVGASTRWIHVAANRAPLVGAAQAGGQVVMLGLVVLFVRRSTDLLAVPAAQVAGDLTAATLLYVALWRAGTPVPLRLRWAAVRPLVPRSIHLVASALLGIVIYNADFIFLRFLRDARSVGLYAAAYTLVTFFLNVGGAYNLSLLPSLTRLRPDRAGRSALYHSAMAHVFAIGLPLAVGGSLVGGALVRFIYGDAFGPAAIPFALLVWCIPLNLLRDVPLMAVMAEGGERAVFGVTAKAAIVNLLLNLLLIPPFGLVGAASATVTTETIRMGLAVHEARRLGFAPPSIARFGRALIAALIMAGALLLVVSGPVWATVPAGVAAYGIGLLITGGLRFGARGHPQLTV